MAKHFHSNERVLMHLFDQHKHSRVNATDVLQRGILISFPPHCEENWLTNKNRAFGHMPRAATVT